MAACSVVTMLIHEAPFFCFLWFDANERVIKTPTHELYELRQKQALPLECKIIMTKQRIREWYDHWDGKVCISFSGGKDSTVLLDLVRQLYPDVPAVFSDTGLEYPEIRDFVKTFSNVTWLRPSMTFRQVLEKYGFPVVSKDVARTIQYAKKGSHWALLKIQGLNEDGSYSRWKDTHYKQWAYLKDAPFPISDCCCSVIKKAPMFKYQKENGFYPYVGTMADESVQRTQAWLQTGCNAYDAKHLKSAPLSFWTENDVLQYIQDNQLPIASCYGEIKCGKDGKLYTTGLHRTGCMFCLFGAHLEKSPNRFERMKLTHPKQYDFCLRNENGLGLQPVLDYLKIRY